MSKKLPIKGFKWLDDIERIDEEFIKEYNEINDKGYVIEADVDYPQELHDLHSDMPFLPERMVINKTKTLVCNLHNKKNYVAHIKMLKQALDHGLKLKKVHRVIEFEQEAWLKKYIDFNTDLPMKARNDFEKDFFKLMNNAVFGKTMENVRKHCDIQLVRTDKKRNNLVSEPNYYTMKLIDDNLAIRPNAYSYITDDLVELKKAKGTKKCVVKKMLGFNDYKKCLFEKEKTLKLQQRFKSENHSVYTEYINKITL